MKRDKDVEEDGRSLRRSRERTCSYAPGRSSTSVSNSRENLRIVIALTSGNVATTSQTGSDIAIEEIIRYVCFNVSLLHRSDNKSEREKRVFRQLIIFQKFLVTTQLFYEIRFHSHTNFRKGK